MEGAELGAPPGRDKLRAGIGVRRTFLLPSPVWKGMGGRLCGSGGRMEAVQYGEGCQQLLPSPGSCSHCEHCSHSFGSRGGL